ncbi:LysR family transcriptional regulator [Vibrio splendidus]|tara:strand:- start:163 stop:1098 length:936 start_codon:yes stop_codon:yes gene_type:complete
MGFYDSIFGIIMLDRIDNVWLQSFFSVYEKHSFAKASEHLTIPSSNVSRHIQQLESVLGEKLFYRTTRKVTPTLMGERLFQEIREPLYNLNQSLQRLSEAPASLKGSVRLSSPDIPIIGEVLADFLTTYTDITLYCEHSTAIENAISNEPDIIISFERGDLDDRDWVSKPLCQWETTILASKECINRYGLPKSLTELESMPCISSYKSFGGDPWVFTIPESNEFRTLSPKSRIKVDGGFTAKAFAQRGLGFVALPTSFCSDEIKQDELQQVSVDYNLSPLTIFIHYRAINFHSHLSKLLVDFIATKMSSSS